MCSVETALKELIGAILDSPEYKKYDQQLAVMREHPDLKRQVDEFRHENFLMQRFAEPDELFDKMDEFSRRYEDFRKNPMVEAFLGAELDFCRMIQDINEEIVEAVNFE